MVKNRDDQQMTINFEDGVSSLTVWPDQEKFPLNIKERNYQVESILKQDIESSKSIIVLTGFTSLSYLIDTLGNRDYQNLVLAGIVLGFEPNLRGRNRYHVWPLQKEIKEYWLKKGLSILSGGSVMNLIEKIKQEKVVFKFYEKLHAKIYVTDRAVILGSSNFSNNGLKVQTEANIRFTLSENSDRFSDVKLIAQNYYQKASPYPKMIDLLQQLIKVVSWEDALARAVAEVIEGQWLEEYELLMGRLKGAKLWPTQRRGLAQAMTILQESSNVLIADPTGAGKTKMCSTIILALKSWLYETGRQVKDNSLIICPPLVVDKWRKEFASLSKISNNQTSSGILSNPRTRKLQKTLKELEIANILAIDEAHNYLNLSSNRSNIIRKNNADFKILVTATPINKRLDDLLKIIELLDVDNLDDESYKIFVQLKQQLFTNNDTDVQVLRDFVSRFTLRRTKKMINSQIDQEPELYKNSLGVQCRFPNQIAKTYHTKETEDDIELVNEINHISRKLYGVTYLKRINKPQFELQEDQKEDYLNRRVNAANKLSIYMIRSRLRSSKMALLEHIIGLQETLKVESFKCSKNIVNKIKLDEIRKLIDRDQLPHVSKIFDKSHLPIWLTNLSEYQKACKDDFENYYKIAELTKRLTNKRELGKCELLLEQVKKHTKVVAFDSSVVTLNYLKHLLSELNPGQNVLVATGSNIKGSNEVMDKFDLTSDNKEVIIALCSDKMSEGVDLQLASAVTLLDMPSVIRIVEQRFGRIDRMDTQHKNVEMYWPIDSEIFSLRGDKRLIELNELISQMWGSNFQPPAELKHKHFKNVDSIDDMISEYNEYVSQDLSWNGIQDSFQPLFELVDGPKALLSKEKYNVYKNVKSSVKTKVSFVKSESKWCFFALRGDKNRSPRWFFIKPDSIKEIYTEFPEICEQLRKNISKKSNSYKWNEKYLKEYIEILQRKEIELLSPKKRRALTVAKVILEKKLKNKGIDRNLKIVMNKLLTLLKPGAKDVDYESYAVLWLELLQPILDEKRSLNNNKRKVFNLYDLTKRTQLGKIEFGFTQLEKLLESIPVHDQIDHKITACIVGVPDAN